MRVFKCKDGQRIVLESIASTAHMADGVSLNVFFIGRDILSLYDPEDIAGLLDVLDQSEAVPRVGANARTCSDNLPGCECLVTKSKYHEATLK